MHSSILVRGGTPSRVHIGKPRYNMVQRSRDGLILPQRDFVRQMQKERSAAGEGKSVIINEEMVGHRFYKDQLAPLLANNGNRAFEGVLEELGFDMERFADIRKVDEGDTVYYWQPWPTGEKPYDPD